MARSRYSTEDYGAKLAVKIAKAVSTAMTDHLRQSGPHRARIGTEAALGVFRTMTAERDEHLSPLLGKFLGHEGTNADLERALRFVHKGRGEMAALLSQGSLASAIGSGIGSGLANLLAPANQAVMYGDPAQVLPPQMMASLAAAHIVTEDYAKHISRMSGLPEGATALLVEGARTYPSMDQVLIMLRRRVIDEDTARFALQRQGFRDNWIEEIFKLQASLLSPEDLALMVLKGIRTEEQALGEAEGSGIDAGRFHDLILMTGEPPGTMQLLEAYRRGFIGKERLEHGVRQSRVRDEWIDVIEKLRFERASPADALRGVIQGHINDGEGKKIAEDGGLDPRDWGWLRETEGNPAANMQMIELWRRGKVTKEQVEQAIREGRTKNKYIPHLLHLKRALPSIYQINAMVRTGAISDTEAARLLHELGYESDVVTSLIHAQTAAKPAKEKQLARAEIQELYYDHAITEERALQLLHVLGYTGQSARIVLSITDLRRERALRQAAMSPIRSQFLAHHITEQEAKVALDAIRVPPNQRDMALVLWTADRAANHKTLTEAQIVKANTLRLLTDTAAESRLERMGYSHQDAQILLDLEKGRKVAAP